MRCESTNSPFLLNKPIRSASPSVARPTSILSLVLINSEKAVKFLAIGSGACPSKPGFSSQCKKVALGKIRFMMVCPAPNMASYPN